jgi:ribosomal protein L13
MSKDEGIKIVEGKESENKNVAGNINSDQNNVKEKMYVASKNGKMYYRHTGFPGGIKETTAGKILLGKYPERVVKMAIKRMISRNSLGAKQLGNLYVYAEGVHPHDGQQPKLLDLASKNPKNKNNK